MAPFTLRLAAICAGSLAWMSCSSPSSTVAGAAKPSAERKKAPDFLLKDSTGRNVKLSDYKGKVVLLNFWATWCGPCKIEIPWFMEFEQNYKDRGFAVLGVAMDDEGWDVVKPYIERLKVNYRVMVATAEVDEAYGGVESLPTAYILDRGGNVVSKHVGLISRSNYVEEIERLLEEKSAGN